MRGAYPGRQRTELRQSVYPPKTWAGTPRSTLGSPLGLLRYTAGVRRVSAWAARARCSRFRRSTRRLRPEHLAASCGRHLQPFLEPLRTLAELAVVRCTTTRREGGRGTLRASNGGCHPWHVVLTTWPRQRQGLAGSFLALSASLSPPFRGPLRESNGPAGGRVGQGPRRASSCASQTADLRTG